jgi:hypothetical protein
VQAKDPGRQVKGAGTDIGLMNTKARRSTRMTRRSVTRSTRSRSIISMLEVKSVTVHNFDHKALRPRLEIRG